MTGSSQKYIFGISNCEQCFESTFNDETISIISVQYCSSSIIVT